MDKNYIDRVNGGKIERVNGVKIELFTRIISIFHKSKTRSKFSFFASKKDLYAKTKNNPEGQKSLNYPANPIP